MTKIITSWSEIPSKKSVDPNRAKVVCILTEGPDKVLTSGIKKKTDMCICFCGLEFVSERNNLRSGHTRSCGCRMPQGYHGNAKTPLYNKWDGIIQRCTNQNSAHYHNYGGRGISVCDDWLSFHIFYEWSINNGYRKGLDIDRIDNNGNYEPSNCRFVTRSENLLNRRNNHLITANGETKHISIWSKKTGINLVTIYHRIKRGWSPEDAVSKQPNQR